MCSIFVGDELLSDSFPLKEIDDIVYRVECKMIKKNSKVDVNIGGNPSAEGEDADDGPADDSSYEVIDVVDCCRLENTVFDKKSYMGHIKEYMKRIKAHLAEKNPERVPHFEKAAVDYVKKIVGDFSKYDFYVGENMDPEAMCVLQETTDDGKIFMIYWKDGLKAVKY